MASNKKWFKRAIRTLKAGEAELWELIKNKLTSEQVSFFENQFLEDSISPEATTPSEVVEIKTPPETTTAEPKVKKVTTKTKSRKASTPKNVGKKKTATKKTKSVSKEK